VKKLYCVTVTYEHYALAEDEAHAEDFAREIETDCEPEIEVSEVRSLDGVFAVPHDDFVFHEGQENISIADWFAKRDAEGGGA
jgi:hypothetical protein